MPTEKECQLKVLVRSREAIEGLWDCTCSRVAGEIICTRCSRLKDLDALIENATYAIPPLTFDELAAANSSRARRIHNSKLSDHSIDERWTVADWSNAMCGESGEAANIVKKIRRIDTGCARSKKSREQLVAELAHELADVIIYADLLASECGIDLASAVIEKFNIVSEREGTPERL